MNIDIFPFSVFLIEDCASTWEKSFSKSIKSFFRDKFPTIRHIFDKDTNMKAPMSEKSSIRDPDIAYNKCTISNGLISQ